MNRNGLGVLYIVATPIGNLQDMTYRAVEILRSVACIAAEDTRHSAPLLRHYQIQTPLIALHDHNERERAGKLLARLQQGESVALISDAGTPLISDPGYYLVHEARNRGLKVVPVPGACAAIAALSAAGLATDRFVFEGFLPVKTKQRQERIAALCADTRTIIFYESPHRIVGLLEDLLTVLGSERRAVVARELTKMFETIHADTLAELNAWIKADTDQQRGEFVVLIEGARLKEEVLDVDRVLSALLEELPLKQAVDIAVKLLGGKKNQLYECALKLKKC